MKKFILMVAVTIVTLGLFSFKSSNEGEEKLVSLKNYKVNLENLKKYNNEFYTEVSTGKKLAACRYYCYTRILTEILAATTEYLSNSRADGSDITISQERAVQLEQMKILSKI